ncbi:hypothetical protein [Roseovarius sp. SYSU LYC5161]|jgi:hypothetical protein|uniref:hypothetical protein n=1 Tax=Roseovarius halophilus (ex Wu et al. 2025) TaxID=3376060 RepID=UPI002871463E|nr:hypothetical protein [Roseovarius sp.]
MLKIFANSFMTAARTDARVHWGAPGHWRKGPAFDTRSPAELVAHTEGRRRD